MLVFVGWLSSPPHLYCFGFHVNRNTTLNPNTQVFVTWPCRLNQGFSVYYGLCFFVFGFFFFSVLFSFENRLLTSLTISSYLVFFFSF